MPASTFLKWCEKLLVTLKSTSSKETILFFGALNNKTIDTFSISRVILTGFWNPASCAWLLGFTAASWLPAMASGMMVGFKTAFFSFRLRTKPSSGKGKQEGLLRPKSVTYKSTAPHRSLQSCAAPRGQAKGQQVRVRTHHTPPQAQSCTKARREGLDGQERCHRPGPRGQALYRKEASARTPGTYTLSQKPWLP